MSLWAYLMVLKLGWMAIQGSKMRESQARYTQLGNDTSAHIMARIETIKRSYEQLMQLDHGNVVNIKRA